MERFKASYRWVHHNCRRGQEWFVRDSTTGEIAAEHPMWDRATAVFMARKMNKEIGEKEG